MRSISAQIYADWIFLEGFDGSDAARHVALLHHAVIFEGRYAPAPGRDHRRLSRLKYGVGRR
jgi:hypothetical protein